MTEKFKRGQRVRISRAVFKFDGKLWHNKLLREGQIAVVRSGPDKDQNYVVGVHAPHGDTATSVFAKHLSPVAL